VDLVIEQMGMVTIVTFPGEYLDASVVKEFKEDIARVIEGNGRKVVFDISRLQFIDSSGLGAILSCLRKLNGAGGDLKLCGMTKPVRALFELVRMHRIMDIYNTRDEAVSAFR
jgi:anti-sigma B factor antagonist